MEDCGRYAFASAAAAASPGRRRTRERREPDKASIREALSIAYFRMEAYEKAESEFQAMLEIAPNDDYAHCGLGRSLEKLGREASRRG